MMIDKGQEARNEVKVATAGFTKKGMMVLTTGDPDKSLLQDGESIVTPDMRSHSLPGHWLLNKQFAFQNLQRIWMIKKTYVFYILMVKFHLPNLRGRPRLC